MEILWKLAFISFLLLSLLTFKFLSLEDTSFNEKKAIDFWYYEVASYCSPSNIQAWSVSTVSQLFPNVQEINVFTNSTGDNQAYTAYDASNDLIILSVRGSSNIKNWLENLDALLINYDKCSGCQVHAGFYGAYMDLKFSIIPSIIDLHSKHPNAKIAVLGHSLGGAIATLAFADISEKVKVDYFYTYGSPRVGNINFANFINNNFKTLFKARLTHYKDPVPHLPFKFGWFFHVDSEVFYDEDSTSYILCKSGEDPNCSLRFGIAIDIADHLDYMGFKQPDYRKNCI